MAVVIDGCQVVRGISAALRQGHDVVDLMRWPDTTKALAVLALAEVGVTLQHLLAHPAPRPATTSRALAVSPGLRLVGVLIAVAACVTGQRVAASGAARLVGSQRH